MEQYKKKLQLLEQEHKAQRQHIPKIRRGTKKSTIWLLEGFILAIFQRAIDQSDNGDLVIYEIVGKVRLCQEATLLIEHFASPEVKTGNHADWARVIVNNLDDTSKIDYRQYRTQSSYKGHEQDVNRILSTWSHASYDNARSSFMYINNDPDIYELSRTINVDNTEANHWIRFIENYADRAFVSARTVFVS